MAALWRVGFDGVQRFETEGRDSSECEDSSIGCDCRGQTETGGRHLWWDDPTPGGRTVGFDITQAVKTRAAYKSITICFSTNQINPTVFTQHRRMSLMRRQ